MSFRRWSRAAIEAAALGAVAGATGAIGWAFALTPTFVPNPRSYLAASLMVAAVGLPIAGTIPGQAIVAAGSALAVATAGSAVIVAIVRGDLPTIAARSADGWSMLSSVWRFPE